MPESSYKISGCIVSLSLKKDRSPKRPSLVTRLLPFPGKSHCQIPIAEPRSQSGVVLTPEYIRSRSKSGTEEKNKNFSVQYISVLGLQKIQP